MGVSIVPTLKVLRPAATLVVVLVVGIVAGYYVNTIFFPDTTPAQPIEFSHEIHAGDNEIPCLYCHVQARRSISAGVPSVNKCMNCHSIVATEKPQVRKLLNYWENQEPIHWIKVHDLPDFVYFPHKRHVAAGVECQTCHGPVETMARVTRMAPVKMGECLACHKEEQVENGIDCLTCHK